MAGCGANTLGVFFERESNGKRTATAGWYNTAAFEEEATKAGLYAASINGDAFSHEIKKATINQIKEHMGKVDLVIYSLAAPRRVDPDTGEKYGSVLKPIGQSYTNKSIDVMQGLITEVVIEPATDEEIANTIKVMGGEDWQLWLDQLADADVLAQGVKTVAYSYIGPDITLPMYREGTIGKAKEHLEATAKSITKNLEKLGGVAYVTVAKALVTQASAAIPIVPLYIAALYKVMKAKGTHEGCIEQIYRLFNDFLYAEKTSTDDQGRIRTDDYEMIPEVQKEAIELFEQVTTETLQEVLNIQAYQDEFFKLFGFGFESVDYNNDVAIEVDISSIKL
jgi:enoyl-[acyl-carrier protein] reductase/trans-2-enoyl-CoA reductase (NAD+)